MAALGGDAAGGDDLAGESTGGVEEATDGSLIPVVEKVEAEFDGRLRQVLVTSWGHAKGEGMVLLEATDG